MNTRFKMDTVAPGAYKAMAGLERFVLQGDLSPRLLELIKIKASQINGCAFCINLHTKDARKLGETEQRIYLLNAWKETRAIYAEEEKVLLAMTEEITLISEKGLSDHTYQQAIRLFGEQKTAHLIMAIITINAWNRISISLQMQPEKAESEAYL